MSQKDELRYKPSISEPTKKEILGSKLKIESCFPEMINKAPSDPVALLKKIVDHMPTDAQIQLAEFLGDSSAK